MKFLKYFLILFTLTVFFTGCDLVQEDAPESVSQIEVTVNNLNPLPQGYQYYAWIKLTKDKSLNDSVNFRLGALTQDLNGNVNQKFETKNLVMHNSQEVLITIEPVVDDTALKAPSNVVVFSGVFKANDSQLSLASFNNLSGGFILDTPTDSTSNFNETSGIWFVLPDTGNSLKPGLVLPNISGNWEYVAYLQNAVDTIFFSTFKNSRVADAFKTFSGTKNRFTYPGEDFLLNAPEGFIFPLDMNNLKVTVGLRNTVLNSNNIIRLFETTITEPANGKVFPMNNLFNQVPSGTVKFILQI